MDWEEEFNLPKLIPSKPSPKMGMGTNAPTGAPQQENPKLHQLSQIPTQGGPEPKKPSFFERHIYGPHQYKVEHQANTEMPGETEEELTQRTFEAMAQHPAPFSLGRKSTPEGKQMSIFPFGQINTMTNPEQKYLTNVTVPGRHILHPGDVKRTAKGKNIVTEGSGYGFLPSLNEKFADALWGTVAHNTRLKTDPQYREQFYKDVMEHTKI